MIAALLKFFPGSWVVYAGVLAASFAAGGVSVYKFDSMRYAAKENARAQQELIDTELAAKAQFRKQDAVITAQNSARTRETRLRADANGARASANGLRSDLDRAMQAASANIAACTALNRTAGELLAQCTERYSGLAAEADRWASDAQMMQDAWPR